jgi:hypothetical protein
VGGEDSKALGMLRLSGATKSISLLHTEGMLAPLMDCLSEKILGRGTVERVVLGIRIMTRACGAVDPFLHENGSHSK